MLGNSSVAAQLAVSQEGLKSMKFVSYEWLNCKKKKQIVRSAFSS
jgi:hypothetical protein